MEQLKQMKERLISLAQTEVNGDISRVDAKELGEVIDMIKDLAECEYYCAITKAMDEADPREKMHYMEKYNEEAKRMYTPMGSRRYYMQNQMYDYYPAENNDKMYYTSNGGSGSGMNMARNYVGRSPMTRRTYMEMKENGEPNEKKLKELEHYMKDLTEDVMEMIRDASPDERVALRQKMTTLVDKL